MTLRLRIAPLAALASIALLGTGACAAQAATYTITEDTLTYQAAPGEANDLRIYTYSEAGDPCGGPIGGGGGCNPIKSVVMNDRGAQMTYMGTRPGCAPGSTGFVNCEITTVDKIVVHLGDGDDNLRVVAAPPYEIDGTPVPDPTTNAEIFGEAGNDTIQSANGKDSIDGGDGSDIITADGNYGDADGFEDSNDTVHGGPGSDQIFGNDGRDALFGDDGNDLIFGGSGPDLLFGGNGNDFLSEESGNGGVVGGPGDDVMKGGPGSDTFEGGDGFDSARYDDHSDGVTVRIDGLANDGVGGGIEKDNVKKDVEEVRGSRFADDLTGNELPNRLFGESGKDVIDGGKGADLLSGGPDNDTLLSLDSVADTDDCGDGTADDTFADVPLDTLVACEKQRLLVLYIPPPKPTTDALIGCSPLAKKKCVGTITLRTIPPIPATRADAVAAAARRGKKLGSVRFSVRRGRQRKVSVRLSRAGRRYLRKRHNVGAQMTVAGRAGRKRVTATRSLLLRAR